jgi:hypothetical protein
VNAPNSSMAGTGDVSRRLNATSGTTGGTDIYTAQGQMVATVPVELVYRYPSEQR